MLIVDDFSRKMWVYFLKYKSDAFSTFQKFKTLVEKESGCNIMTLRTESPTMGGNFVLQLLPTSVIFMASNVS